MRKKWAPKVKVVRKAKRPFYLLRWKTREGVWAQEATEIPVPPADAKPREEKIQRGKAVKAAAEKEQELAAEPLAEHMLSPLVDLYEEAKLGEGLTRKHVLAAAGKVRRAIKEVPMAALDEIEGAQVSAWFNKLRSKRSNWRTKKSDERRESISYRTINSYLEALKAFCNWLVAERKLQANPLTHLQRRNQEEDRRRIRRAMSADEFGRLVATAEAGPVVEAVSGPDRAMLYIVACWTGYRAAELASVMPSDLELDSQPPVIRVRPKWSKRGRDDRIPIHPVLVQRIRDWIRQRGGLAIGRPIFPLLTRSGRMRRTAEMIRADQGRAKVDAIDETGAVADFHACRHTFVTNLIRAGASLPEAQRAARHSDPRLTLNTYGHLGMWDDAHTIARLPAPPQLNGEPTSAPPSVPFRAVGG